MQLFHAIVVCKRDEHLIPWHVEQVARLGIPMVRWCYYGTPLDGLPPTCREQYHVVPALELYENLPVKTYCLLRHALTIPGWTHLLKTDVNSYPTSLDVSALERANMIGYRCSTFPGRVGHITKVSQKALAEPYRGDLPQVWCGGPAYAISRLLALKVVQRGVWYARGWPYEDVMVSMIATMEGMPPETGIGYQSDGRDQRN